MRKSQWMGIAVAAGLLIMSGCSLASRIAQADLDRLDAMVHRAEDAGSRAAVAADNAAQAAKQASYSACKADQKFREKLVKGALKQGEEPCAKLLL